MQKAVFVALHYVALLLFALACWGYGRLLIGRMLRSTQISQWLSIGMCSCFGIAVVMLALQAMALYGLLEVPWLLGLLAGGWLAVAVGARGGSRTLPASTFTSHRIVFPRLHWTVWFVLLLGLGTGLSPLRPPYMWDELSFHLAHAKQWAQTGRFQVNEWLRYPWSPFSFHFIYAAALVLYDDVMPHLLHALTGWLTALFVYQLAVRYSNRVVAGAASVLWLALSREGYMNAYVDMAVAVFLVAGWTAFVLWREQPSNKSGLAVAAFLLGTAAATKYQALGFLPYFALALLALQQRARNVSIALAFGLLPCAYWYVRNAVLTGDPFDPLGGSLFGYYDWNRGDIDYQLLDVHNGRGWPNPLLWPAAAAPLLLSTWRNPGLRAAMLFCTCAVAVWLATSHLPRYLLPVFPLLSVLAAHVAWTAIVAATGFLRIRLSPTGGFGPFARGLVLGTLAALLALLSAQTTARSIARDWKYVASTPAQREAFLGRQLWEFKGTLDFLHRMPRARIYQNGMEAALYYAPEPIWGDHFGPWRWRDFMTLAPAQLAVRLRQFGFDTLVARLDFNRSLLADAGFSGSFQEIYKDDIFGVYRLRPALPCHDKAVDTCCDCGLSRQFVIGPSVPASGSAQP